MLLSTDGITRSSLFSRVISIYISTIQFHSNKKINSWLYINICRYVISLFLLMLSTFQQLLCDVFFRCRHTRGAAACRRLQWRSQSPVDVEHFSRWKCLQFLLMFLNVYWCLLLMMMMKNLIMYIYTYIHTHIYIYIYIHIYVHLELMDLSLSRMTRTWIEEAAKRDHVKGCEDGSGGNTSKIELITWSFPARSSSTNERYWNLEGHWSFSQWCDFNKRFVYPDGSSMPFSNFGSAMHGPWISEV